MEQVTFFDGLLEQVEFEHKLFESVLAVNFRKAQVLKEDGQVDAQTDPDDGPDVNPAPAQADQDTEDTTKSSFLAKAKEKLIKFFENIKNWFVGLIKNVVAAVKKALDVDARLTDKYFKVLDTTGSLKGFPGIKDFKAAKVDGYTLPVQQVEALLAFFGTPAQSLNNPECKDKAKVVADQCAFAFDEVNAEWNKDGSANYNWRAAFEFLKNGKMEKDLLKTAKSIAAAEGSFKQKVADKTFDITAKIVTKQYNEKTGEAQADRFKMVGENFHVLQDCLKTFVTTYIAYFKAIRRAIVACGTYALKAQKGEAGEKATPEQQAATETFCWAVDLQSVQYMDESFSFT